MDARASTEATANGKLIPRLLNNVVDRYAAEEPDRAYVYAPVSSNPGDGYKPITYKSFANAINLVAHKFVELRNQINSADSFPTFAYIGPNDIRYIIVMLACVKARCQAFFLSPRNSMAADLSLLKATNTAVVVYADTYADKALMWLQDHPMVTFQAPSPDAWLEAEPAPSVPYSAVWEDERWHPAAVIHTSGSTGLPKPIVIRQGSLGISDLLPLQPDLNGAPSLWHHWCTSSSRILVSMPFFHTAAIVAFTMTAIYYGQPLVLMPPDRPMTPDTVIECMAASGADTILMAPSIIEELATTEEGIMMMEKSNYVSFGGGPLSPAVGDMLTARGVKLVSMISSTECAPYHLHLQGDPKLWNYLIINSASMGAEFRAVDGAGEDIFEMFLKRKDKDPGLQSIFYTFPEKDEWSTGDLYQKHPTLPDHYLYAGRGDDIIVLSNGEKLNPVTTEKIVTGHRKVKMAMVVGAQRFQPGLILELYDQPKTKEEADQVIEEIWPAIEEANKVAVAHGRIVRRLVCLAETDKPFLITPKGTLRRAITVKLYKDSIDDLYEDETGDSGIDLLSEELDLASVETLTASIVDLVVKGLNVAKATPETDLFSIGLDSMQIITLSKQLQAGLASAGLPVDKNTIPPRVIYANPIPKNLGAHLFAQLKGQGSVESEDEREVKALRQIIDKYTSNLPEPNKAQIDPLDDGQTVLITGTTGSLGAYMLDRLITNPRIKKIIALNRGGDGGASRQPAFNVARGLSTNFSKVQFHGVDLSLPTWGLSKETYDELLTSADRIIHNAWPVNFNINVSSFEPFIRGVRHLVDFSIRAAKRVAIIFISSVSTVHNWAEDTPVPERHLAHLELPVMGYGRSKAAGSFILEAAARISGVPAASIRVGLIVGSRSEAGTWNKQEYIPSLVASSLHLGMLPDSIGPDDVIDWVPVEDVAGLVLDVSGITEPRPLSDISGYFHCVNPETTTWATMVQSLKEYYGERIGKIVSLSAWVTALEKSALDKSIVEADIDKNPGIKLIDTYQGFLASQQAGSQFHPFATERTKSHSNTMQNLKAVSGELMKHWCGQWKY